MPGAATTISRRLGGPRVRRRRHRRFAIGAAALLVLAFGLIVLGRETDDFDGDASAVCEAYAVRIQDEFRLSFPDGVPDEAAFAEYTSHAFADTMDDMLAELSALDPPSSVAAILDGYSTVLSDIRARPEDFVAANPFTDVAAEMDAGGPPACGSAFFATFASPE